MKALLFSAPVLLILGWYVTYKMHLSFGLFLAKVFSFVRKERKHREPTGKRQTQRRF